MGFFLSHLGDCRLYGLNVSRVLHFFSQLREDPHMQIRFCRSENERIWRLNIKMKRNLKATEQRVLFKKKGTYVWGGVWAVGEASVSSVFRGSWGPVWRWWRFCSNPMFPTITTPLVHAGVWTLKLSIYFMENPIPTDEHRLAGCWALQRAGASGRYREVCKVKRTGRNNKRTGDLGQTVDTERNREQKSVW